ncbi:hypothetical protein C0Q70_13807 [Pomacea canaliculata]|uniref:Uncharacterized protein n=1 Tax=Pomacea canaliculata TaxID=400727 RepID=A0A2T7NY95_POMCA|nr:hypothetical protein C0Q70_13807 [Pomacea canaliculata]
MTTGRINENAVGCTRNRLPRSSRRWSAGPAFAGAFRSCNRIIGSNFQRAERSPDRHGRALSLETQSSVIRYADAAGRKEHDEPSLCSTSPRLSRGKRDSESRANRQRANPYHTFFGPLRNRLAAGRDADNDHFRPRASHAERALSCRCKNPQLAPFGTPAPHIYSADLSLPCLVPRLPIHQALRTRPSAPDPPHQTLRFGKLEGNEVPLSF